MVGKIGERKRLTDFIKEHNQVFVSLRHNHAPKNFLFFSLCVLMFFHHRVIGSIIFRSFSLAHHRLLRIGTETRKKTREGKKKKKPVRGVAQENSFSCLVEFASFDEIQMHHFFQPTSLKSKHNEKLIHMKTILYEGEGGAGQGGGADGKMFDSIM